jgi:Spy/CpxP family protein refolding chaperone
MIRKLTTLAAAAAILAGLGAATPLLAAETAPSSPSAPAPGTGMMGGHDGMHMNAMMGPMSPEHIKQMTRMMDECSRMMQSATNTPAASTPGK